MKRRLTMLLAIAILVSAFSGCHNENTAEISDTETEQSTITKYEPRETEPIKYPDNFSDEDISNIPEYDASAYEYNTYSIYNMVGTGKNRPDAYKPDDTYYSYNQNWNDNVTGLKNADTQDKINAWIKSAHDELSEMRLEFESYIRYFRYFKTENVFNYEYNIINRYLFIKASLPYYTNEETSYLTYDYECRNAVFDLYTGEKLEISDLFFNGEDFVTELNAYVNDHAKMIDFNKENIPMKRDFDGISTGNFAFLGNRLVIPTKNPHFSYGANISCYPINTHIYTKRDMADIFTESNNISEYSLYSYKGKLASEIIGNTLVNKISYYKNIPNKKLDMINEIAVKMISDKQVIDYASEHFGWDINNPKENAELLSIPYDFNADIVIDSELGFFSVTITSCAESDKGKFAAQYFDYDDMGLLNVPRFASLIFGENYTQECYLICNNDAITYTPQLTEFTIEQVFTVEKHRTSTSMILTDKNGNYWCMSKTKPFNR